MKLYSYQENCLNAIDSDCSNSQLISMPTGTGKTITFLSAIKRKNKRCLVLVHRQELLQQTYDKALLIGFEKEKIATITSDKKEEIKILTIAMVPTLIRNLDKYNPNDIEMMVVDEAHHAMAKSYITVFSHFKMSEEKKLLLGFTATPLRGDKKSLGSIFHSHSFKMTLSEATQQGYICPVYGMRIDIQKSFENIDNTQGDYDISQLDRVMNCESINNLIVERCEHLKRSPSIVFCTSVDHAQKIATLLRKAKRKAISISYHTPKKTLDKIFFLLRENRIEFITNAVKLSEGFDHPPIQSIILARPTRSPVLYKQMIGRGLRKHEGKIDCLVLEFTGNDDQMIRWEDIDENCTFQSTNIEQKKSIKDAILFYKGKFDKNIIILDVRLSMFNFYECKIARLIKFKDFRIFPFQYGFCVFEFIAKKKPKKTDIWGRELSVYMCFWKEEYKSFYIWSSGGPLWESEIGWNDQELEKQVWHFIKNQGGGMGKWYPSEEDPISNRQKKYLKNSIKMNSRKAEMTIEDSCLKGAVVKFWINQKMPQIDGENTDALKPNHDVVIYDLRITQPFYHDHTTNNRRCTRTR